MKTKSLKNKANERQWILKIQKSVADLISESWSDTEATDNMLIVTMESDKRTKQQSGCPWQQAAVSAQ